MRIIPPKYVEIRTKSLQFMALFGLIKSTPMKPMLGLIKTGLNRAYVIQKLKTNGLLSIHWWLTKIILC